jgi:hypothetical protein
LKEERESFTVEFFHLKKGSSATDAIECVDSISEVDIIVKMGVHYGVNGVNDGFSNTG